MTLGFLPEKQFKKIAERLSLETVFLFVQDACSKNYGYRNLFHFFWFGLMLVNPLMIDVVAPWLFDNLPDLLHWIVRFGIIVFVFSWTIFWWNFWYYAVFRKKNKEAPSDKEE